jgi:MraZ protein
MENAKVPSTEIGSSGRDFMGKHSCTLDGKNRLTIPKNFRRLINEDASGTRHLVICRAKDHRNCLALYSLEYFAKIIARLRSLEPGAEKRRLIRFYSNESEQLRIDRFGRVQLSPDFLEVLGNAKELVVSGELEYMEIWRRDDYRPVRDEALEGFFGGTFEP